MQDATTVKELRVAMTVTDMERAVRLYRDGLGLPIVMEWATHQGRGMVLAAGRATLELIDHAQAEFIDQVEVGQSVSGPVRLALEFADVDMAVEAGQAAGARLLHAPVRTPWNDRNARLVDPGGMQLTFFQPLDEQPEADAGVADQPNENSSEHTALSDRDAMHLRKAIEIAARARVNGNHPFGALLVTADGAVLDEAENTVVTTGDVTGHAEMNLARQASQRFDREVLSGATLYTSTEPCAMCAGAIYWTGIGRVVFALSEAGMRDLAAPNPANDSLALPSHEVFARGQRPITVVGPYLEDEARAIHAGFWD